MATHEQMMGGPDGQNYQGCVFPAQSTYRLTIQSNVRKVGQYLASQGAIGHFSVDFLARRVDLSNPSTPVRLVAERHTPETSVCEDEADMVEANCAFDEDGYLWDLHALEVRSRFLQSLICVVVNCGLCTATRHTLTGSRRSIFGPEEPRTRS